MKRKIKVAIADDHKLFRQGLKMIINEFEMIELIYEAANGNELLKGLETHVPDLILMDLKMPEMDGLQAISKVRKQYPKIKVIVLSMFGVDDIVIEAIKRGASGYLMKQTDAKELELAIKAVMDQGIYLNDHLKKALQVGWTKKGLVTDLKKGANLTKRECMVLKLICQQLSTRQIANRMHLSPRTIDNYRLKLLEKTGAKNVAGLAIFAIETNLIEPDLTQWED